MLYSALVFISAIITGHQERLCACTCMFQTYVSSTGAAQVFHSVAAQIAANIALVKNWTIHGIFWGAHQQAQPRIFRRTLEESVQWLAEGKVRVPVSHK